MGLKEMVMTMSRLATTVDRKTNKKTMKSIFFKCGFCVSPKRTNSVTLLGGLRTSIQQVTPSWGLNYLRRNDVGYLSIMKDVWSEFLRTKTAVTVTMEHILGILAPLLVSRDSYFFHDIFLSLQTPSTCDL